MGQRERPLRKGIAEHVNGEDSYLYMPGEILVDVADDVSAERLLDGAIERRRDIHDKLAVAHYDVHGDVPELVERLRKQGIRSGPNHVLSGEPRYKGGPGSVVEPADEGDQPTGDAGHGVSVAVLDTGYTTGIHLWLDGCVDHGGAPVEDLDAHALDGGLDDEAGHGTFIAGVINSVAPGASIRTRPVLLSDGWGDEATIAAALADCNEADIINLSLGAYTQGNLPPIALANALRHVPRTSVVVAAAGNAGVDVPFWPAALKQVVAVAAIDEAGNRACFSNYGHWVDCALLGVDVTSTFPVWQPRDPANASFKGWARWSGTSFSAPRMAGAIAAEMSAAGGPATDALHRVLATAKRIDPLIGAIIV